MLLLIGNCWYIQVRIFRWLCFLFHIAVLLIQIRCRNKSARFKYEELEIAGTFFGRYIKPHNDFELYKIEHMSHGFLHEFSTRSGHCVKVTRPSDHNYFIRVEAAHGERIEFEWEESSLFGNSVKPAFTGSLKEIQDEVVVALEQSSL